MYLRQTLGCEFVPKPGKGLNGYALGNDCGLIEITNDKTISALKKCVNQPILA